MNRRLLALAFFLCTVSLPTYGADWVLIEASSSGGIFVDKSSLQKDGDNVTFWTKANYSERQTSGELSSKAQVTFNCRRRERIVRYIMMFDDNDHRGRLIASGNPTNKWQPIPPGTVSWVTMQFVCPK